MNQFVETTHTKNNEQLTELTPHIVNLSGSQKVGVVFWEIAINPHSLIKREQYSRSDAIIGEHTGETATMHAESMYSQHCIIFLLSW